MDTGQGWKGQIQRSPDLGDSCRTCSGPWSWCWAELRTSVFDGGVDVSGAGLGQGSREATEVRGKKAHFPARTTTQGPRNLQRQPSLGSLGLHLPKPLTSEAPTILGFLPTLSAQPTSLALEAHPESSGQPATATVTQDPAGRPWTQAHLRSEGTTTGLE